MNVSCQRHRIASMAAAILNSALYVLRSIHDDTRITRGQNYAVVRHCSPFVYYQRFDTHVAVSLLGREPVGPARRIFLQRRGWRTALLGWRLGGLLGGTVGKDVEVTPENECRSLSQVPETALSSRGRSHIATEIKDDSVSDLKPLETSVCHIPASAPDGYYRLRVTTSNPSHNICSTPVFRLLSSSPDTPSPRGATLAQLPVEFGAKTAVTSVQVAAWSAAYALFPFLAVGSWLPGASGISKRAMDTVWRWAGAQSYVDDKREQFQVDAKLASADQAMPWGAVGVRRQFDIDEDRRRGRGGYVVRY